MLHYLVAASVGYLQNYCYGIGTRVVFEPGKETSSRSFPDHHLAFLVKKWDVYLYQHAIPSEGLVFPNSHGTRVVGLNTRATCCDLYE